MEASRQIINRVTRQHQAWSTIPCLVIPNIPCPTRAFTERQIPACRPSLDDFLLNAARNLFVLTYTFRHHLSDTLWLVSCIRHGGWGVFRLFRAHHAGLSLDFARYIAPWTSGLSPLGCGLGQVPLNMQWPNLSPVS